VAYPALPGGVAPLTRRSAFLRSVPLRRDLLRSPATSLRRSVPLRRSESRRRSRPPPPRPLPSAIARSCSRSDVVSPSGTRVEPTRDLARYAPRWRAAQPLRVETRLSVCRAGGGGALWWGRMRAPSVRKLDQEARSPRASRRDAPPGSRASVEPPGAPCFSRSPAAFLLHLRLRLLLSLTRVPSA
jgi:hypothetical protein